MSAPPGRATRPTSDRVREAVFNSLYSMGDVVRGARVADLFAGSGALGVEALSRGAAHVVFVEQDPRAASVIEANLSATGLRGAAEVVRADVMAWSQRAPGRFDLVLCDPPYEFDRWAQLLAGLDADVVVAESDRVVEPGPGWEVLRARRYGTTVVSTVRRREPGVTPQEIVP